MEILSTKQVTNERWVNLFVRLFRHGGRIDGVVILEIDVPRRWHGPPWKRQPAAEQHEGRGAEERKRVLRLLNPRPCSEPENLI
jgi:hypothetical protein